jgi:putative transcriptional regulator
MMEMSMLEMMLVQYAAGALSPAEALMMAAHMTLRPDARKKVAQYEALGGKLICDTPPAPVSANCFEQLMAKIDNPCGDTPCADQPVQAIQDHGIPPDIMALLNTHCTVRLTEWKKRGNNVEMIDLCAGNKAPRAVRHRLRLVRLAPAQSAPPHRHNGTEITLVLAGGFRDQTGHYGPGDIVIIADPGFVHAPQADDTGCTCLSLTEAPLCFQSRMVRILNVFWRI